MATKVKDLIDMLIEHDPEADVHMSIPDGDAQFETEAEFWVEVGPQDTVLLCADWPVHVERRQQPEAACSEPEPDCSCVEDAIELAKSILDDIGDIPEAGEEFAESVREQVDGILITLERTRHVTDKQGCALKNMREGVDKWINPDDWR